MPKKSEFGRGLVICLAKFLEHFSNSQMERINNEIFFAKRSPEKQKDMLSVNPPSNSNYGRDFHDHIRWWASRMVPIYGDYEAAIASDIASWANGASDHLYDIQYPTGKEWKAVIPSIKKLQNLGLDMGHGDGLMGKKQYGPSDLDELSRLTKKILVFIDRRLGLDADWGTW